MINEVPFPIRQAPNNVVLELCIDSVESALAAERGGAARVELCSSLLEGGITPGPGLISTVRSRIAIGLYVMVRPRGGDFCYTDLEFEAMQEDIRHARHLGADGIVLGVLQSNGKVDIHRTRSLVELAHPLPVTFHRAIDMTPSPVDAVEDVVATGAVRILTSGGMPNASQGLSQIARMVETAHGRITIMPGGGIRPHNLAAIAEATGAREFHTSARSSAPSPMTFRKPGMSMGEIPEREYQRYQVREEDVQALVAALAAAEARPVGAPAD